MTLVTSVSAASGAWLRLVLDASPGNVLTRAMASELAGRLAGANANSDLKLLTLEGAGSHFTYGASVPEHLPPDVRELLPAFHAVVRALLAAPVPTAAVVRGRCLGGGFELALACDLIFASDDASLGVPEVTLGVFPPAAAALLPLRIGAAHASRAVLTGEILPASRWHEIGLVTAVAPAQSLTGTVEAWFNDHLAPRSAVALRHASRASREVLRAAALPALAALERQYLGELLATHDGLEGCRAFVEKRAPVWANR